MNRIDQNSPIDLSEITGINYNIITSYANIKKKVVRINLSLLQDENIDISKSTGDISEAVHYAFTMYIGIISAIYFLYHECGVTRPPDLVNNLVLYSRGTKRRGKS